MAIVPNGYNTITQKYESNHSNQWSWHHTIISSYRGPCCPDSVFRNVNIVLCRTGEEQIYTKINTNEGDARGIYSVMQSYANCQLAVATVHF